LLGILLIGLVGLNVSLLKLNAAAGKNAEWAKQLRVENADLGARVSRLRSAKRIQRVARDMGFVMPAAASVHYLTADPGRDAPRAAARERLTAPPSNDDIVTYGGDSATIAAPLAAPASTTAPAQTGTETTAPTAAPATGTPATGVPSPAGTGATGSTGATGAPAVSPEVGTGATVP
jgi:hypothetical protein